jgi:hypothetical protein
MARDGRMAVIRVSCPSCGAVNLAPDEIRLRVHDRRSHYVFTCPICHVAVAKDADERITGLLLAGGVQMEQARLRPAHPECPPRGEPFDWDDLLDLHLLLEASDWFERLLAAGR